MILCDYHYWFKSIQIAAEVAAPLSKTDEIVIIGGDDKVTSEVTKLVSQLPPTVQALTGVDLTKVINLSFFSILSFFTFILYYLSYGIFNAFRGGNAKFWTFTFCNCKKLMLLLLKLRNVQVSHEIFTKDPSITICRKIMGLRASDKNCKLLFFI